MQLGRLPAGQTAALGVLAQLMLTSDQALDSILHPLIGVTGRHRCQDTVSGMPGITLDELLARARSGLDRLDPAAAAAASRDGAILVDVRAESQIARDGTIPGALVIGRNVLEWRLALDSDHRHPQAPSVDQQVIIFCDSGYASSLAAAGLQELGFTGATDLDGGFQAWRQAGLPVRLPKPGDR